MQLPTIPLSALLFLAAALPASAGFLKTSPLAFDTTRLESHSASLYRGLLPPNYRLPEEMSYEEYQTQYPREAIATNALCYSSTTTQKSCRVNLHFSDTTISLTTNSFFSKDSLYKANHDNSGVQRFQEAYDREVVKILQQRRYGLDSLDLTHFSRTDRTNGALLGAFMLVPSFVVGMLVERGIATVNNKPYNWGHVGLLTGGFMVGAGVTYAIVMDPKPTLSLTRIRFTGMRPAPMARPAPPPDVLE